MSVDLYQDSMIAMAKRNDYTEPLADADCEAVGHNPLCGDRVTIQLQIEGLRIVTLRYQVRGCLLCKASSALLASLAEGMNLNEFRQIYRRFDEALKAEGEADASFPATHTIFQPARPHRSRHSCLLLPYETMMEAVSRHGAPEPES